jgi:FkbM family methyltransferase
MDAQAIPALLKLVRLYTFYSPLSRGKHRLLAAAKGLSRHNPQQVIATTKDGRRMQTEFGDWAGEGLFFLGTYETFCTQIVSAHIAPGMVCLDVGANIGWYATLFAQLVGPAGAVHAFEPVPDTYQILTKNVALNPGHNNVHINNFGLGAAKSEMQIHMFPGLPCGHASLASRPDKLSYTVPVKIETLDWYLQQQKIAQVDFVKVDIEGAELQFLQGASSLFAQARPPVFFMEMALENTREFGYKPDDLVQYLAARAPYDFFRLDELKQTLIRIEGFVADDPGANVLCVPR